MRFIEFKKGVIACLFVGVTAMAIPGFAYAQSNQPLRLAPVVKKAAPSDLSRPSPRNLGGDIANPRSRSVSSRITGGAVEVDSLKALDADEAGTLTPLTGALGSQMWNGTSREMIERLLDHLPSRAPSSAMRVLMHKLLLSPARVPESSIAEGMLITKRLEALIAMGALEEADQLFDVLPTARAPELAVLEAKLRFLSNDNARACALAEQEIAASSTDYWQKVFTFCQIIKGDTEKAGLGLSLMRELGETDALFLALAEVLISGEPQDLPPFSDPTPLQLAMARVGKVELPGDVISANTPSVLRAIALSPKTLIDLRLEAAERADAAGALPGEMLRQLYTSVEFSDEDLANPLSRAEIEFGPKVRALLYRTSLVQTVPTAKAEATARAFALARDEGRYASTVHVFQPVLESIPASSQLAWFAPEAVRALLLSGERSLAKSWYQVLQASAITNEEAAKAIDEFRPLAKLFDFDVVNDLEDSLAQSWWRAASTQANVQSKGILLFAILDAMNKEVEESVWERLIDWQPQVQQSVANPALVHRLRRLTALNERPEVTEPASPESPRVDLNVLTASTATDPLPLPLQTQQVEALSVPPKNIEPQRVGEVVLLSLLAIGDEGPAKTEVGVLSDVLRALTTVGLTEDARALALEAALANGL